VDHLIIDGFNLAFRAHYGYYDGSGPIKTLLKTSKGILSGCVYGFLSMLRPLKNRLPQCHITISWDTQSTRKKQVFAEYKANRPAFVLSDQIKDLKGIFSALNISQVEYEGEESDDVIASLVRLYKEEGTVYVYTGDKDMLQLVEDGKVIVISPKNAYDEAMVKKEYGVYPKDLTCYFCLRGDTVDNVPGVPRVKSSLLASLAEKYKNLDNIYANLQNEKLTEFQLQSLVVFKNQSLINYQLIKLRDDLNLDIRNGVTNPEVLALYFNKYEIKKINPNTYSDVFRKVSSFNKRESLMVQSYSLFD
jgi:DNA polymerase-1